MFLESLTNLKNIIDTFSTTIFVIDPETELNLNPAIKIVPETPSSLISIDDVREMIALTGTKQTKELYLLLNTQSNLPILPAMPFSKPLKSRGIISISSCSPPTLPVFYQPFAHDPCYSISKKSTLFPLRQPSPQK